ncbi:MAG: chemotaxis protein CheD [Myxococcota bacterium]
MTVAVGELSGSREAGDTLIAHALGSCVAVIVRDRAHGACAVAHVVVPGPPPPVGAVGLPAYYASVGVPAVLDALGRLGGHLGLPPDVVLIGGASLVDGLAGFNVGRRNVLAVRRALWAVGIVPIAEDVEGTLSRTVTVDVATGAIRVRNPSLGTWSVD